MCCDKDMFGEILVAHRHWCYILEHISYFI